jgi:beta-lactamase superfamily II metal-dependent hydrolase
LFVRIKLAVIIIFLFQAAHAATNLAKRLIPLFDRVLIQKAEAVTKTKGGIVIPEKAQAKVLRGTVVAVGPGSRNQVRDAERHMLYHISTHVKRFTLRIYLHICLMCSRNIFIVFALNVLK